MGGAIAALLLERHPEIEKGVLCCPGLELKGMGGVASLMLSLISLFKKRIPKAWQSDSRYHMHYEGAPCDDEAIGNEYWKYLYPRQIVSLVKLAKKTKKNISSISSPVLFIGAGDDALTVPESVDTFSSMVGEKAKSIIVSGATHYVYYDISPEAEEKAVSATLDFLK